MSKINASKRDLVRLIGTGLIVAPALIIPPALAEEKIKLGVIVTLSGPAAALGLGREPDDRGGEQEEERHDEEQLVGRQHGRLHLHDAVDLPLRLIRRKAIVGE